MRIIYFRVGHSTSATASKQRSEMLAFRNNEAVLRKQEAPVRCLVCLPVKYVVRTCIAEKSLRTSGK
jgi:hypothetical protein